MAFTAYTDGLFNLSINQGAHTADYEFYGSWSGGSGVSNGVDWRTEMGYTAGANFPLNTNTGHDDFAASGNFTASGNDAVSLTCDEADFAFRSVVSDLGLGQTKRGSTIIQKTVAVTATASTPTSSAVTFNSATIACNFFPNTLDSTSTTKMQYRKFGDSTWIDAPGGTQSNSGYSQVSISRNLTGLLSSTLYEFRLSMTRNTVNATTLDSVIATFTTSAGAPSVVTNAVGNVAATSAILNGTLTINDGTGVNVFFKWDTVNPPVANQTANQPKSASGAFEQSISGLAATTTYFFQAFASFTTPTGSPVSGSVLSFTTPNNPAAEAAAEDHLTRFDYDAFWGVQRSFVFLAASPAATTSDKFLSAAVPWSAAECQITKDAGTPANATNAPTRIGTSAFYELTLTATELQAEDVHVWISDSGTAARDVHLHVRTKRRIGQEIWDPTQIGGNTAGFDVKGVGTQPALSATGGATSRADITGSIDGHIIRRGTVVAGGASTVDLDASASASNDFYNGALITIISGTGANQQRVIIDYDGSNKRCTVDSSWISANPASGAVFVITPGDRPFFLSPSSGDVNYDADGLATIPTTFANWGQKLQAVFQRFFFKRTQTATVQTLFDASSSTTLGTATVSDAAGTQTVGKLS